MPPTHARRTHNPFWFRCIVPTCHRHFRKRQGLTKHIRTFHHNFQPQSSEPASPSIHGNCTSPSAISTTYRSNSPAPTQCGSSHADSGELPSVFMVSLILLHLNLSVFLLSPHHRLDHVSPRHHRCSRLGTNTMIWIPTHIFSMKTSMMIGLTLLADQRPILATPGQLGIPPVLRLIGLLNNMQQRRSIILRSAVRTRFTEHKASDPPTAIPCDQYGYDLLPNAPPHPTSNPSPDDWSPYGDRVEFEFAEFIYRKTQMSATNIDTLLDLWAAKVYKHGDSPPFSDHNDLYETIDASPLGDVPWQSFTVNYTGERPEGGRIPPWMETEYEVWFRDPLTVVRNLLANPDFNGQFDYTPMREFTNTASGMPSDNRRFQNFFSGNWVWTQAVKYRYLMCILRLNRSDLSHRIQ
jgi:hypothetical protein